MKVILKYILAVIFFLLFSEGIVRLIGIPLFPNAEQSTERSEPSEYAGFDPKYGPYPIPGKFQVLFTNKWCQVTHNKDSNRITRPISDIIDYTRKPKINIYGCSYTWGTGISDSSTYPYLVQKAFPFYNVQNKGIFAAGNVIAYLQIKEEIRRHQQPAIALVAYASFHDQRNTFNREWAIPIKESVKSVNYDNPTSLNDAINHIDTIQLPHALILHDSLCIEYKPLAGNLFPFSKYSAICNLINYYINYRNEEETKSNEVTRKIFFEINKICKQNGIRLIVTCIDNDKNTLGMQDYFKKQSIEFLSFGVDWNDKNYNLYPDEHPNEKAHVIYAKKIVDYLAKNP